MYNHTDKYELSTQYHPNTFLVGALFGGLLGAGIMMLFAPQSGKRTRAQIQRKGLQMREQATDAFEEGMHQTRRTAHKLKAELNATAKEIQDNSQELLDEQKVRLSAAVSAGKKAIHVS